MWTGKIETQTLWFDKRAVLLNLGTQVVAQGFVQEMGCAMIAYGILAALLNDTGLYTFPDTQVAFGELTIVYSETLDGAARILNLEVSHCATEIATVAN